MDWWTQQASPGMNLFWIFLAQHLDMPGAIQERVDSLDIDARIND
jgi:hypothetical protein